MCEEGERAGIEVVALAKRPLRRWGNPCRACIGMRTYAHIHYRAGCRLLLRLLDYHYWIAVIALASAEREEPNQPRIAFIVAQCAAPVHSAQAYAACRLSIVACTLAVSRDCHGYSVVSDPERACFLLLWTFLTTTMRKPCNSTCSRSRAASSGGGNAYTSPLNTGSTACCAFLQVSQAIVSCNTLVAFCLSVCKHDASCWLQ